jgi:TPR repeat protein
MNPAEISLDLWESAESGDAEAQHNVGLYLWIGREIEQDCVEAVKWLKKSADQGYVPALDSYGVCVFFGIGRPSDFASGLALVERAVSLGNVTAVETKECLMRAMILWSRLLQHGDDVLRRLASGR